MHLLATRPGGYAAGDGVVDLRQTPADLVILSAADTDLLLLAGVAEALPPDYPTLRLASLLALRSNASVDLYFDAVLSRARLVIVALIGGTGYWPYGVDRLVELARDGGTRLVLVPGDDTFDPELERLGSVSPVDAHAIWRYLREGGRQNARALFDFVGGRFFGRGEAAEPLQQLARVSVYHPERGASELAFWQGRWQQGAPVAALLFYRAHLQAGNLRAFDAMITALERQGLAPLPIALGSLKDPVCRSEVERLLAAAGTAIVLNTTGFALAGSSESDADAGALGLGRPVLQVMVSGGNVDDWRAGSAGLSPRDLAMSVVLPELDGRIITRAVTFKGLSRRADRAELDVAEYQIEPERAAYVAELAARWVELGRTPVAERRVALVLANYPARDGRIGNGVGLDTPASTLEILRALARQGYPVTDLPGDAAALMRALGVGVTNELGPIDMRPAHQSLSRVDYEAYFAGLPAQLREAVERRWGPVENDPRHRDGRLVISGLEFGATFVGVQPARGYEIDVAATYHDPELVPPHGYLAFYAWLRRVYRAHAIVHVGKHGNLEWLPGKSVALGPSCWPDAVFGPLPHLYPFIVNDPGEGTQAKRRAQAVIIDHLVPPLTRAESYGALRDLEKLVDEYYQASTLDPPRAQLLRRGILDLARDTHLSRELGFAERPASSADAERLLVKVDAYLCELKESQIRDGLHVFGRSPSGEQRTDTLVALARLPARRGDGRDQGLIAALARALLEADGPRFDPLDADFAAPWQGPRPALLAELTPDDWRSVGDTRERLELLARAIIAGERAAPAACRDVVDRIVSEVGPLLDACGPHELGGLLRGLDGRYVTPGPSGAPSRGRLDVLPTGRNFYSVDVRSVPTSAAVELARRAADRLVQRYVQDQGNYPRSIALSVWGTATMRTGGDDIAQALCLLGVRPVWADGSGRVIDTEILPLSVLRRPRVDVVLRISGFFRDAFPDLIRLFDSAVRSVAELDETDEQNPVRARVRAGEQALLADGVEAIEAARRARYRIFGSRPGAYGAGLQSLIDSGRWRDRQDLAEVFLAWSGYAYGGDVAEGEGHGVPALGALRAQLAGVDAVLQNQDNREHDLLDSSDYYEFQGGLGAAVELVRGRPAALYHGDHSNPAAPRVRSLREEVARVMRSRVVNPKWIAAARRHGYKGAAEMAATVEYLFGYAATTALVEDYQFAMLTDAYVLDDSSRRFLDEHNPSALREMTERLLEAMQRGLWREPGAYRDALEAVLLDVEEGGR